MTGGLQLCSQHPKLCIHPPVSLWQLGRQSQALVPGSSMQPQELGSNMAFLWIGCLGSADLAEHLMYLTSELPVAGKSL